MLLATTGAVEERPAPAMNAEELIAAQALIRRVPVGETVMNAILALVRGGRPDQARTRLSASTSRGAPAPGPRRL